MIKVGVGTYGETHIRRFGTQNNIEIGKYCSLAENIIMDGGFNHNTDNVSTYPFAEFKGGGGRGSYAKGDIIIKNDVWICMDVMILSGVTIGNGAVVAARSVVTKDVPDYAIVAGNPAKVVKYRFPKGYIKKLLEIKWWDWTEGQLNAQSGSLANKDIKQFIKDHGR